MIERVNFFYTNQKHCEIFGVLNRRPKNGFNYFVLSTCYNVYNNDNNILYDYNI